MNCFLGKPWRWAGGCCALKHQLKISPFYLKEEGGKKKVGERVSCVQKGG